MNRIHLWPEESFEENDQTSVGFTLENPDGSRIRMWYRIPPEYHRVITKSCDPFVIASIFKAMHNQIDLVVHGEVSPSLLSNLEEFQDVWTSWKPERYTKIDILPDQEREPAKADISAVVAVFSGGVDSSFTAWYRNKGLAGRRSRKLQAGLMLHGFDIPYQYEETFKRASKKAKIMLDSLGMTLIPMVTNLIDFGHNREDGHGAFLVSCLALLQGGYSAGLISSTDPYSTLVLPGAIVYGSNLLTDELLSSLAFPIIHIGAGFNRIEKIHKLANWPEAMQYLRVCLGGDGRHRDQNCCRCEKCIRNILAFRVAGLGLPPCFESDVTTRQIAKLPIDRQSTAATYQSILARAKASHLTGAWVLALMYVVQKYQIKSLARKSAFLTRLFRSFSRK